jgi:hypothetical protein
MNGVIPEPCEGYHLELRYQSTGNYTRVGVRPVVFLPPLVWDQRYVGPLPTQPQSSQGQRVVRGSYK